MKSILSSLRGILSGVEGDEAISMKYSYIYIITNKLNTVFYVGVTTNLIQRIYQHRNKLISGFSSRYNLTKLVYFETFENVNEAIKREKQIKGGSRQDKLNLIRKNNPYFKDLYDEIASA